MDKPMTLRLPEPQAEALSTVAEVLGLPVVEVVRLAVADYIDRCRREPSFQERLRDSAARMNRAMDSLRWPERGTGS
ncbi:MAG TPA: DNA-binding protein [Candidatus Dormibacteraeota bacterium]|nr:DNA-binding protein [Candidatus Dormibacteraeota bacterium]